MKKEHKIWWEGIADQYEEWASNPPTFGFNDNIEYYTCSAFFEQFEHWGFMGVNDFEPVLHGLFKVASYADLTYPIGHIYCGNRETKREAFCQDMADTIRENIGAE